MQMHQKTFPYPSDQRAVLPAQPIVSALSPKLDDPKWTEMDRKVIGQG